MTRREQRTGEQRTGAERRSGLERRTDEGTTDHAAIGRLSEELLPALIAKLSASGLGELEVRQGPWRIRLRKPVVAAAPASPAAASAASGPRRRATPAAGLAAAPRAAPAREGTAGGDGAHAGLRAVGPGGPSQAQRTREAQRALATSPAVGFFAARPEIAVGTSVQAGDVIGHVEVLGVRQEVVAPIDGVIGRLLVQPGQAVEYGQDLIRIELGAGTAAGGEG